MPRRHIQPTSIHPTSGYTHGVLSSAGTLYIAGQVAKDSSDAVVGVGDMEAQATQVFNNIGAILAEAGGGFDDLVKLNIYLTDARLVEPYRKVRATFVKDPGPASTLVVVAALASPDFVLEVEAVADLAGK